MTLFRVKISKPIDLADRVPSVMDHGIFTFDSYRELKVGKLLEYAFRQREFLREKLVALNLLPTVSGHTSLPEPMESSRTPPGDKC
jgi:hypothetical protein